MYLRTTMLWTKSKKLNELHTCRDGMIVLLLVLYIFTSSLLL
ncbi:unnamed protein product [Linum tenue]|uniref:Uncharacterized protein n=1 Tax=Linum tenue TaxID=586396 RepID=A0AAV0I9E2_9ROSI|nr:unnamed protein product [Linum tenue]